MGEVTIYGPDNRPIEPSPTRRRAMALAGGWGAPFDAGDIGNPEMRDWNPYLWSPDSERSLYRDRIVARVRDLARNDGWASGAISSTLDAAIGATWRPVPKPDYSALAAMTGNKAFDAVWAREFSKVFAAHFRTWANDVSRWCDASRHLTFTQMCRLAFRHKLVDGDALAVLLMLPENLKPGRAKYATAVQIVDPDRLSNPNLVFDTDILRGGVEIDRLGAAIAYWIRRAHQGDWYDAGKSMIWDRLPRETATGRPIVVHDFDHERGAQHHGGAGILTPVVARLKMLAQYDRVELQAAIVNAIFGAYVESPFDQQLFGNAFSEEGISAYQDSRKAFHEDRKIMLGNVRLPMLFPGEKVNSVKAERPAAAFAAFEGAMLRNVSAATGNAAPVISHNWADVNYSSARAALLEAWRTMVRRRNDFAAGFCQPIFCAVLEESMARRELPLPSGAPAFRLFRNAYGRSKWIGPGMGWIDPVKEKQGAILGMDAGMSTLENEVANHNGDDWEEVLEQRALEVERFKELGLPPPSWTGMAFPYQDPGEDQQGQNAPAQKSIAKPQAA
jgi:lambda family phage portal protein